MRTIIHTHGGGRFGNQVIRWIHWLAWARAHEGEVEVINLAFWPYAALFKVWRENLGCAYPKISRSANLLARCRASLHPAILARVERRFPRLVNAAGNYWPGAQALVLDETSLDHIDMEDRNFLKTISSRRVTTCSGWRISCWQLVAEQQAELREFFRPSPNFAQRSMDFVAALRKKYEILIGIHIRQSDYRVWHDGRFGFSTESYVKWIKQLLCLHPGKSVGFVVASDEWQDPELFFGLPVYFATGAANSRGFWFGSWIELSLCDLVVGPPSTFSATAAYVGAVPLWPLITGGQYLSFDQIIPDSMIGAARHPIFSLAVM